MHIIAVDDEKIALKGLVSIIEEVQVGARVSSFQKPKEALAFAKENVCDIAFLDIEMRGISGIELAKMLKVQHPTINIIFTTGYSDYAGEAFGLYASGYVMKPVTAEKIAKEIENLRYPLTRQIEQPKIVVQTFGNFEVYMDDVPVKFQYSKTKELFAYLVNSRGALCTNNEIMAALWEDEVKNSYYKNIRADLLKAFPRDFFVRQWGRIGVTPKSFSCDYYDWLDGKLAAINAYTGEYMLQYSWAENTLGDLKKQIEEYIL